MNLTFLVCLQVLLSQDRRVWRSLFSPFKGNITISPGPNHSHKLSHCGQVRCSYFLESLDIYSCLAATSSTRHQDQARPRSAQRLTDTASSPAVPCVLHLSPSHPGFGCSHRLRTVSTAASSLLLRGGPVWATCSSPNYFLCGEMET